MNHWIFPSSWSKFDLLGAFAALHELDWRKNCTAKSGDIAFMYLGAPVQKIVVKAAVIADDVPATPGSTIDDRAFSKVPRTEYQQELADTPTFLRLSVLACYVHLNSELSFAALRNNGLTSNLQGPLLLKNNKQLCDYIMAIEGDREPSSTSRSR